MPHTAPPHLHYTCPWSHTAPTLAHALTQHPLWPIRVHALPHSVHAPCSPTSLTAATCHSQACMRRACELQVEMLKQGGDEATLLELEVKRELRRIVQASSRHSISLSLSSLIVFSLSPPSPHSSSSFGIMQARTVEFAKEVEAEEKRKEARKSLEADQSTKRAALESALEEKDA